MTTAFPPPTGLGRGSWTNYGMPTNKVFYYQDLTPHTLVGHYDTGEDPNYYGVRAVHLGVQAIQSLLKVPVDGRYGPVTAAAVAAFETSNSVVAISSTLSGILAPGTAKTLFGNYIKTVEKSIGVPGNYLCGIAMQESTMDPGAVGYYTPDDKGLVQFNLPASGFTVEQAMDPTFAIPKAAERFKAAWKKYAGNLQVQCSIAQHNSPAWADQWHLTGNPPNTLIAQYVANVEKYAATF